MSLILGLDMFMSTSLSQDYKSIYPRATCTSPKDRAVVFEVGLQCYRALPLLKSYIVIGKLWASLDSGKSRSLLSLTQHTMSQFNPQALGQ